MAFTDRFGNGVQEVAYPSINKIALTNAVPNVTLSWPIEFQNVNGVVAAILHITTDANGHSITLPPSNIVGNGQTIFLNNINGGSFTVLIKNPDGTTLITLGGGNANTRTLYLADNQTQSGGVYVGTWIDVPWGGGYSAVTSVGLAPAAGTANSNFTVTGSPITTTGTFSLDVKGDLKAILELGTPGFVINTGIPGTWATRELVPTANQIAIDNPDGTGGNPQIKLAADISGLTSLQAGNLKISADTIANQALNSDIILTPNGTGELSSTNNLKIKNGNLLKFYNSGSTNFVSFSAPAGMSADYNIKWPVVGPAPATFLMHLSGGQTLWQPITQAGQNLLVNGGMTVWQPALVFDSSTYFRNNNGQFVVDYYRLWSDGDNRATVTRQDGPNDPSFSSPYAARLTVVAGGENKKFGISQFVEYADTQLLKGRTVSFSFAARNLEGSSFNLRAAIIYGDSTFTADSSIASLVQAASWGAAGTNPLLLASWNYINAPGIVNLPLTSSWTRYTISNVQIPSSNINNLGIFIWLDNVITTAGHTIDISCVKLEYGPVVTPFECGLFSDELRDCQRIFENDLPYGTAIGTNNISGPRSTHTAVSPIVGTPGPGFAGSSYLPPITFFVQKLKVPTTLATYPIKDPYVGGIYVTSMWTTDNIGTNFLAGSAAIISSDQNGIQCQNRTGADMTFGQNFIMGHWYVYAGI